MKRATNYTSPLLRFLRAMPDDNCRDVLAEACGTTRLYLYQLAAQEVPNPRLRLAVALCEQSRIWGAALQVPPLTIEGLLEGRQPITN